MNDQAGKFTSRREFIMGAGATASVLCAAGLLGSLGDSTAIAEDATQTTDDLPWTVISHVDNVNDDVTYVPRPDEYPTLVMDPPETTEYTSDVLVVGGGLAALNAAYAAAEEGKSVVLVDKGTPGYSGLSAWPSCTAYYDPDLDADQDMWDTYMRTSCDSFANLDWEDAWLEESKATYERLRDWGWTSSYDNARDAGYWVNGICFHDNIKGYFMDVLGDNDRRKVFMNVLGDSGVTVVDHTMVTDFVQDDEGKAVGAVGIHFKSGTFITFTAKAVVLCTGSGVVRSSGFPVGADTFDGLWMGYMHGLPITGMEFDDFHEKCSFSGDNVLMWEGWQYLEPVWPTGGTVTQEMIDGYATPTKSGKWYSFIKQSTNGGAKADWSNMLSNDGADCSAAVKNGNTDDPRIGKYTSPLPKTDRGGGAPGMPAHLAAGIWCGLDELTGQTPIVGLYAAGDGTNASYVGGPN